MQLLRGRTSGLTTLAISPDSRFVVAASVYADCHVWDLFDATSKPRQLSPDVGWRKLAFSSATTLNAFVDENWWRYDLAAGIQFPMAFPDEVEQHDAILHPSGEFLKAFGQDWNLLTARIAGDGVKVVKGETPVVVDLVTFDPTGVRYLADHFDPTGARHLNERTDPHDGDSYHLRDTATDRIVTTFEKSHAVGNGGPHRWVFSPDGRRLFADGYEYVAAYDCEAGGPPVVELSHAIPNHQPNDALAVHPGGRLLATVEGHRTVTLRDADTLQPLKSYDFAMPKLTCVAFTPDGTRCVVGNSRGKVLLFDVE